MPVKFALHIKKLLVCIENVTPESTESAHNDLTFNKLFIKGKLLTSLSKSRANRTTCFRDLL